MSAAVLAAAVLAQGSRSFRLAGRLLPKQTLEDAARLYAFCRGVDDLADESADPAVARTELLAHRAALLAGDATYGPAQPLLALHARCGVSVTSATTLIDTVLRDLATVQLPDEAALLDYAYGAAGTVGEMMCAVLGVRSTQALPHAVDLGMAMQLTNIARDVLEDAARGRIYLPAAWLPADMEAAMLASRPEAAFPAVRLILARADRLYRSGERGYADLPPRVRPAIRAASRLYEEIGLRILRQGPAYLRAGRCVVPMSRKLVLVASCLIGTPRLAPLAGGRPASLPGLQA